MDAREKVKQSISNLVKSSGKDVLELAKEAKIGKSSLYAYLNGEKVPDIFTLKKLCRLFSCEYVEILGEVYED